ncbi:MAG: transposase [Leptolyngbyaceae cyanobacterium bins.302]|nr:transposase [Leptolyngbyaceae cyanobacterium bins.302]
MKGRKRTAVVDVLGLVLKCHVGAANEADVKAAPGVLFWALEEYARLAKVLADQGYQGDLEVDLEAVYGVPWEIVKHEGKGFSSSTQALGGRTHLGMARECTRIGSRLRTFTRES